MSENPGADLERARAHAEEVLANYSTPEQREQARRSREKLREGIGDALAPLAATESPATLSKNFSYLLDDLVRIPGTNIRFGVDPVLSLFPELGSTLGAIMGSVVLIDAVRLRAPISVITRMVSNYLIDWLIGLIPFIGALFDVVYRSNRRNLELLQRTIDNRELVRKSSIRYWLGILALFILVLLVIIGIPVLIVFWIGWYLS